MPTPLPAPPRVRPAAGKARSACGGVPFLHSPPWVRRWGGPAARPKYWGGASACHPPYLGRAAARQPARSLTIRMFGSGSSSAYLGRAAARLTIRMFAVGEQNVQHVQSRSQQHVQSRLTVRPLVRVRNFLVPLPTACCMGACCSGRGLAPAMSRSRVADLLSSCM